MLSVHRLALRATPAVWLRIAKLSTSSSPSPFQTPPGHVPIGKVIYEAVYTKNLLRLKKVSIASSFMSVCFLPVSVYVESGVAPIFAQVAIASSVLFLSLSSTIILHLVCGPYICRLTELEPIGKDRHLRAHKVNLIGRLREIDFMLSEVVKPPVHPFASCHTKRLGPMYIAAAQCEDEEVKRIMAREAK